LTFVATGTAGAAGSGSGSAAADLPFTGGGPWTLLLASIGAIALCFGVVLARSRKRAR
jgi:hypothetical protein